MSIRGTAGYNLGGQNSFGGGPSMGGMDKQNEPGALDAIREQTSKIEDFLDTLSDPVKPYVLCSLAGPRRRQLEGSNYVLTYTCTNNLLISIFLQILTSHRTIPNCCYIFGGCIENNYTMERSIIIST